MLRFLSALAVTASSIAIGFSLSLRLSRRGAVLGDYIALLDTAADRMTYTAGNLAAVFSDNFAGVAFDPERPFADQWEAMAARYRDVLRREDIAVLEAFADGLGRGDLQTELNHIRLYQSLLRERMAQAGEDCRKKGSLYRILPFSIGLVLTILIL